MIKGFIVDFDFIFPDLIVIKIFEMGLNSASDGMIKIGVSIGIAAIAGIIGAVAGLAGGPFAGGFVA